MMRTGNFQKISS